MSKRDLKALSEGFTTNPMDAATYNDADTEETDALFSALSAIKRPKTSAIVAGDGDVMELAGWRMTPTGLSAPQQIDRNQYREFGRALFRLDTSMQWLIGDYINLGDDHRWGETYTELAEEFGYAEKTLREYAYITRNVDLSIRMDNLSFGHHQVVASMDSKDQAYWLKKADTHGLSIAQLRGSIKQAQLPAPEEPPRPPAKNSIKPGVTMTTTTGDTGTVVSRDYGGSSYTIERPDGETRQVPHNQVAQVTDSPTGEIPSGDARYRRPYPTKRDDTDFTELEEQWERATLAWWQARKHDMSHAENNLTEHGIREALENVRSLVAHLNYIESKLQS